MKKWGLFMSASASLNESHPGDRRVTLQGTESVLRRHMLLANGRRRRAAGRASDEAVRGAVSVSLRDWFGSHLRIRDLRVEPFDRAAPPVEIGAALVFGDGAKPEAFALLCPRLVRRAANARLSAVEGDETDALNRLDAWLALPLAQEIFRNLNAAAGTAASHTTAPAPGDGAVAGGWDDPRLDAAEIFVLTVDAVGGPVSDAVPMRMAIAAPAIIDLLAVQPGLGHPIEALQVQTGFDHQILSETLGVSAAICANGARLGDVARLRVGETVRLPGAESGCVWLYPDYAPEAAISFGEIGAARGRLGFRIRAISESGHAPDA